MGAIGVESMVGLFAQVRCAGSRAIRNLRHEMCSKKFWHSDVFQPLGIPYPKQLGLWDGGRFCVEHSLAKGQLLVKLDTSFLGAGDLLLRHGQDFENEHDVPWDPTGYLHDRENTENTRF